MNALFTGLKEDNQKLADDIRFTQQENCHLKSFVEQNKLTIQQQQGVIQGL